MSLVDTRNTIISAESRIYGKYHPDSQTTRYYGNTFSHDQILNNSQSLSIEPNIEDRHYSKSHEMVPKILPRSIARNNTSSSDNHGFYENYRRNLSIEKNCAFLVPPLLAEIPSKRTKAGGFFSQTPTYPTTHSAGSLHTDKRDENSHTSVPHWKEIHHKITKTGSNDGFQKVCMQNFENQIRTENNLPMAPSYTSLCNDQNIRPKSYNYNQNPQEYMSSYCGHLSSSYRGMNHLYGGSQCPTFPKSSPTTMFQGGNYYSCYPNFFPTFQPYRPRMKFSTGSQSVTEIQLTQAQSPNTLDKESFGNDNGSTPKFSSINDSDNYAQNHFNVEDARNSPRFVSHLSLNSPTYLDIPQSSPLPQNLKGDPRHKKIKTELCIYFVKNEPCPYGNMCNYAHGEEELRYTKLLELERAGLVNEVDTYRTHPCISWVMTGSWQVKQMLSIFIQSYLYG